MKHLNTYVLLVAFFTGHIYGMAPDVKKKKKTEVIGLLHQPSQDNKIQQPSDEVRIDIPVQHNYQQQIQTLKNKLEDVSFQRNLLLTAYIAKNIAIVVAVGLLLLKISGN